MMRIKSDESIKALGYGARSGIVINKTIHDYCTV